LRIIAQRKEKMKSKSHFIVSSALIAAVYATLTLLIPGFTPIQFRVSEALTVLPAIMPSSIPGLFIGCLLANLIGPYGTVDIIFGSLATLLAAVSTYLLRRYKLLFPLPPAIFNGLIVGTYVYLLYNQSLPLPLTMLSIAVSELVICYGLGLPLVTFIKKNPTLREALRLNDQ
jgi:uncharacterized membrane protein